MFFKKVSNSRQKGTLGEKWAIEYLKNSGYKILEKNYRYKKFEIDVIAEDQGIISFIEVKMEKHGGGWPSDLRVCKEKKKNIITAAKNYLKNYLSQKVNYRFDIIRIIVDESSFDVRHIKNAFNENRDRNIVF